MGPKIDLTYQRVAVQNASAIGLTILLYDRLVTDIQAGITAMQKGEIQTRCDALNHAFLILQQLQCNLNMEEGGETAKNLETFYLYIHSKLIDAQVKNSPQLLQDQIKLILGVRSAWYEVESRGTTALADQLMAKVDVDPRPVATHRSYNLGEHAASSWSA